jgi:hypothetical protein
MRSQGFVNVQIGGRDPINITISMRTELLGGTGAALGVNQRVATDCDIFEAHVSALSPQALTTNRSGAVRGCHYQ